MEESKSEFVKRKKSEKRLQAERQVKKAYENRLKFEDEDESGMGLQTYEGFEIDGKFYPWRIQMEPEIEDLYSTIDISKVLNISRERLRDWMVKGFIIPSLPSISKGTIAIFTRADVLSVALLNRLIERGFKRETASEYVSTLINAQPKPIDVVNYIILKSLIIDGEADYSAVPCYQNIPIDLKIDTNGNIVSGPFGPININEWEDLHIINMIKLRHEVDVELKKLG